MTHSRGPQLALPLGFSVALHVTAVAVLLFAHGSSRDFVQLPYAVKLLAAPVGPKDAGLVTSAPPKVPPKAPPQRTAPVRSKTPEVIKVPTNQKNANTSKVSRQTPTLEAKTSVKANSSDAVPNSNTKVPDPSVAGSTTGGAGDNVTDVLFHGLEFPNQRYLDNIVSRIAKHFEPPPNTKLVAELSFDINRDGCLSNLKVVKGSTMSAFDLEAQVAVKKAGEQCGFTPLPPEWKEAILSVRFRFDPKFIK